MVEGVRASQRDFREVQLIPRPPPPSLFSKYLQLMFTAWLKLLKGITCVLCVQQPAVHMCVCVCVCPLHVCVLLSV